MSSCAWRPAAEVWGVRWALGLVRGDWEQGMQGPCPLDAGRKWELLPGAGQNSGRGRYGRCGGPDGRRDEKAQRVEAGGGVGEERGSANGAPGCK